MKTLTKSFLALCLLLTFFYSCSRPDCKNSNPIFDKYSPENKEYKDELVKQLNQLDKSSLTYWFEKYEEKEEKEYLHFSVQGENLCARIILTVNQWENLENLRKVRGESYKGAKFKNLEYTIHQDTLLTEFTYVSHKRIID